MNTAPLHPTNRLSPLRTGTHEPAIATDHPTNRLSPPRSGAPARSALRLALPLLLVALLVPGVADAKKKRKGQTVPQFYEMAAPTLATVEFNQEFVAGGQNQQTKSYTDGVVISADGLVLISGNVRFPQRGPGRMASGSLPELTGFRLFFSDGREHEAEVVTFDTDLNLGLLRIVDAEGPLPHVSFTDDFTPEIGTAFRSMTLYTKEYGREPVYSPMSINAMLETPQDVWSLAGSTTNLVGAPLWNARGKVVGVVAQVPMTPGAGRMVRPRLSGPVGLSYARFQAFITDGRSAAEQQIAAQEKPPEDDAGWLGIEFQALGKPVAKHLGISEGGAILVTRVIPGSPAGDAGLAPLDILVAIDGARIAVNKESDLNTFIGAVRAQKPGATMTFTREARGGASTDEVAVTLANSPKTELHAERRVNDAFELTVRELTLDTLLGQRLDPTTTGVVVDGVTRAGWGGLAGLSPGMIIQRINEHDVTDLDTFEAALAKVTEETPEKVLFFVRFRRDTRFFVAEPDWDELSAE